MEATIAKVEAAVAAIDAEIADRAVACDGVRLTAACERLDKAQATVEKTYARWQELEAKAAQAGRVHRGPGPALTKSATLVIQQQSIAIVGRPLRMRSRNCASQVSKPAL